MWRMGRRPVRRRAPPSPSLWAQAPRGRKSTRTLRQEGGLRHPPAAPTRRLCTAAGYRRERREACCWAGCGSGATSPSSARGNWSRIDWCTQVRPQVPEYQVLRYSNRETALQKQRRNIHPVPTRRYSQVRVKRRHCDLSHGVNTTTPVPSHSGTRFVHMPFVDQKRQGGRACVQIEK